MSDDEITYIDDDQDDESGNDIPIPIESSDSLTLDDTEFLETVSTFSTFFPSFHVSINHVTHEIKFEIPTSVLPTSMAAVYGFSDNPILFNVRLILNKLDWLRTPTLVEVTNPIFGQKFIGGPLIRDMIKDFFGPVFQPRRKYRAEQRIFVAHGQAPPKLVSDLVRQGYESKVAEHALLVCNCKIDEARNFLITGEAPTTNSRLVLSYKQCPPIYFALELVEAILDIPNCCCICRKPLPISGIRPTICEDQLCSMSFKELGIGNSVTQEIKRDPVVADLLFSIFSGADFQFLDPPQEIQKNCWSAFQNLPPMSRLASLNSDTELLKLIGPTSLAVLRWALLSQRSHITLLPEALKIKTIPAKYQFMTLLGSPESERDFRDLKYRKGSCFLWHGSHGDRWCSILRNGLKNATGTKLQINGSAHGAGIYLAPSSATSWGYCTPIANKYRNSQFGTNFPLIALCEIAKVHELKSHGWAYTLTEEKACMVRFLMIGNFSVDTLANPPSKLPTMKDILMYHASLANQK